MKRQLAFVATSAFLIALAVPGIATAADAGVVAGRAIGTHGTLLVATKNDMTLYTFDKDVAGSGVSSCTGGCVTTWPPLTVSAGETPTGGGGVTGSLGTITRADSGAIQVTYDGKPLYFFASDAAPGDTNGIYANWRAVVLAAAAPAATPAPPAAAGAAATPSPASAPTAAPQAATTTVAVTPPPTSTTPGEGGHLRGDSPALLLLVASLAVVGFAGAVRRLAAVRA